jgi:hypothetical protein
LMVIINGWWFGTWILWLSILIGNFIIPTDSYFSAGYTTNHL